MKITYDRDKDLVNIGKHGISLAEAEFLDWENALIWFDDREDYGEDREIALAGLGNVLFYVAFVERNDGMRIIKFASSDQQGDTKVCHRKLSSSGTHPKRMPQS